MDRRTVLKGLAGAGSLAATGGLSMPALSQGAAARTLRFVPQADLANFDPIWGTQYVVRNAAALVWDTLYGVDAKLQPQRQMVEVRGGVRRRPDLDLPPAAGAQIPRRRAGAGQGRGGEPDALVGARSDGPDDQGDPERAHRRRRPDLQMGAEEALSEDAAGARQEQFALRLHHAGAHRQDRPVQADQRICRLGPDEVRQERVGARRQSGVRKIRRLRAAAGEGVVARRRQADAGRSHRMGGDPGSCHGGGRAAERRDRLVGKSDPRSRAGAAEEPQHQRRHRRPARQYRCRSG